MADQYTQLNVGVGGDIMDEEGVTYATTYYDLLCDGSGTSATLLSLPEYSSLAPNRAVACINEALELIGYLQALPIVQDPSQGVFEFSKDYDNNAGCVVLSTKAEALKQTLAALTIVPDPPMGVIEVSYQPEDNMGNCLHKMTKAEVLLQELISLNL